MRSKTQQFLAWHLQPKSTTRLAGACWPPSPFPTWHAEGLGHGDEVWVDVCLVLRVVPLSLALAQVGVRAVGLPAAAVSGDAAVRWSAPGTSNTRQRADTTATAQAQMMIRNRNQPLPCNSDQLSNSDCLRTWQHTCHHRRVMPVRSVLSCCLLPPFCCPFPSALIIIMRSSTCTYLSPTQGPKYISASTHACT
jgi:hypothetical protein